MSGAPSACTLASSLQQRMARFLCRRRFSCSIELAHVAASIQCYDCRAAGRTWVNCKEGSCSNGAWCMSTFTLINSRSLDQALRYFLTVTMLLRRSLCGEDVRDDESAPRQPLLRVHGARTWSDGGRHGPLHIDDDVLVQQRDQLQRTGHRGVIDSLILSSRSSHESKTDTRTVHSAQ